MFGTVSRPCGGSYEISESPERSRNFARIDVILLIFSALVLVLRNEGGSFDSKKQRKDVKKKDNLVHTIHQEFCREVETIVSHVRIQIFTTKNLLCSHIKLLVIVDQELTGKSFLFPNG